MAKPLRILMVEDMEDDVLLVKQALQKGGFSPNVKRVECAEDMKEAFQRAEWDLVISDYFMPNFTAEEALSIMQSESLDLPFIIVSGAIGEDSAVAAMKAGAHDYVMKDKLARLAPAVERELKEAEERRLRRFAEAELKRRAEDLANSNEELLRFAYVASHDLKEPLRTITLNLELVNQQCEGKFDADIDSAIGFAIDGAKRMYALIEGLLSYTRLGAGAEAFKLVDCNVILNEVLSNLHLAIQNSGAKIIRQSLPKIMGDSMQMLQVFQNLLSNAIKFQRDNETPRVEIDAVLKNGEWIFSVKDNGTGISSEYFHKIFEVFKRLHPADKYPGTGIGLSICKKIVKNHGGRIWVESEEGKGCTFFFTIPKANETSHEVEALTA